MKHIKFLNNAKHSQLIVSFVVEAGQSHVFNAFDQQLKTVIPIANDPEYISFDKQSKSMRISSNREKKLNFSGENYFTRFN